MSRQVLLQI